MEDYDARCHSPYFTFKLYNKEDSKIHIEIQIN